jgi:hypothetical protein
MSSLGTQGRKNLQMQVIRDLNRRSKEEIMTKKPWVEKISTQGFF